MKLKFIFIFVIFFTSLNLIFAQKKLILEKNNISIVRQENEAESIKIALDALIKDFEKVMRVIPKQVVKVGNNKHIHIIIVDGEIAAKKYNIKPLDGDESHRIFVDSKRKNVYLQGNDMRGTIYAIYSFSEKVLGVPPLWYFSSWVPKTRERIEMSIDFDYHQPSPQVRYRSWFPNDMDFFKPWIVDTKENEERFLETLLRSKINCLELDPTVQLNGEVTDLAKQVHRFGLIVTSHHYAILNASLASWDDYWKKVNGVEPPELLLSNENKLIEFWRFNIEAVHKSGIENIWSIGFRGARDAAFWHTFNDAPESERERGKVINRMCQIQIDLIKEITGNPQPNLRITFYDELSDFLAMGYLDLPAEENMIWTYVATRRDHFPNKDIVNFDTSRHIKLGYYMNMQFTSTGSHMVEGEGPWKMEANYRYVNSKSPLWFSVVNAGNIREFVFSISANAAMMWNMDEYDSDAYNSIAYCRQYFGNEYAEEIAKLYKEFYNAYWEQRTPDFENMRRQYIFQDMRYARAIEQICSRFKDYSPNPLQDIVNERVEGRTFNIAGNNQVDSILAGMTRTVPKFRSVAQKCTEIIYKLPKEYRPFFNDNLRTQAYFMANMSEALKSLVLAYKVQSNTEECIMELDQTAYYLKEAKKYLDESQHGVFKTWYKNEHKGVFRIERLINSVQKTKEAVEGRIVAVGKLSVLMRSIEIFEG